MIEIGDKGYKSNDDKYGVDFRNDGDYFLYAHNENGQMLDMHLHTLEDLIDFERFIGEVIHKEIKLLRTRAMGEN